MRAFVELRRIIQMDKSLAMEINNLSKRLDERIDNHDAQLASKYEAMENMLDKEANKEAERKEWLNRHLPKTPFIWHLSGGEQQGFDL